MSDDMDTGTSAHNRPPILPKWYGPLKCWGKFDPSSIIHGHDQRVLPMHFLQPTSTLAPCSIRALSTVQFAVVVQLIATNMPSIGVAKIQTAYIFLYRCISDVSSRLSHLSVTNHLAIRASVPLFITLVSHFVVAAGLLCSICVVNRCAALPVDTDSGIVDSCWSYV